jgi:hypothetical protein
MVKTIIPESISTCVAVTPRTRRLNYNIKYKKKGVEYLPAYLLALYFDLCLRMTA